MLPPSITYINCHFFIHQSKLPLILLTAHFQSSSYCAKLYSLYVCRRPAFNVRGNRNCGPHGWIATPGPKRRRAVVATGWCVVVVARLVCST